MKRRLFLVATLVAVLLLVFNGIPIYASTAPTSAENAAADRILVKFRAGTPDSERASVNKRHGGRVISTIPGIDVQLVQVARSTGEREKQEYGRESSVQYAEPDYIAYATLSPNDPYLAYQWGLTKIQAQQAWDVTQGSALVKIAILDTGIDQNHPDLASKIVANRNFTTSATADDLQGHGTHTAGIAAAIANNGAGVAGLGFNTSLMNVKVLDDRGSGAYSWISSGIKIGRASCRERV